MKTVSLELTTFCNARCSFCTHDRLIKEGLRPHKHISFDDAKKHIDIISGWKDVERIVPVGLGEPTLYPHLIEVIKYIREAMPYTQISLSSNGSALPLELINRIDTLTISLCYPFRKAYEKNTHLNYDKTINSVKKFLLEKGERSPITKLHIFNTRSNRMLFPLFWSKWTNHLGEKDFCYMYPIDELTTKDTTLLLPQKDNIMIDIDGNVYNSCMGVWYPSNQISHLKIGRIEAM